jgi:hypothetical protein
MKTVRWRWQYWVNLTAGAWLFASPWALGFLHEPGIAAGNALVIGAGVFIAAMRALWVVNIQWPAWVTLVLGAWGTVAPSLFSFATVPATNTRIMGLVIFVASAWLVATEPMVNDTSTSTTGGDEARSGR